MLYNAKNNNLFCIFYLFVTKYMPDFYCMKFIVKNQEKNIKNLKNLKIKNVVEYLINCTA